MSNTRHARPLLVALAIVAAGTSASALAQSSDFNRGEQARKAFIRAEAASKAPRVRQPATEAEAVAQKRFVAEGVVEMPLSEDRMLHLVRTVDADGNVRIGHGDDDHADHSDAPVTKPEAARE